MATSTPLARSYEIESAERRSAHAAVLWLLVALGAVLRVHQLGAESYWIDETTMVMVSQGSAELLLQEFRDGRPPVYVLLARLWSAFFGVSETATRSLPALIGVASLPLVYLTGRRLFGTRVGLLAAAVMAIAPIQIYHAQEHRYYGLLVFFALLSFLLMVRALETGRRADFVGYVVASVLMFYTHSFAMFAIAGQNLYVLLAWRQHRSRIRPWVVAQVVIALALLPMLWFLVDSVRTDTEGVMQWLPDVPPAAMLVTLHNYLNIQPPLPISVAIALAVLAVGAAVQWWRGRRAERQPALLPAVPPGGVRPVLLSVCWLLCPIVLPFVLSKLVGPMYHTRYTLAASPAIYLLVAAAMVAIGRVVPPIASLVALAVLIVPNLAGYYARDIKEQWRELAAHLEAEARPGDVIVLVPKEEGTIRYALETYYRGDLPVCELDARIRETPAIADAFRQCVADGSRAWVVIRGPVTLTAPYLEYFVVQGNDRMRRVASPAFVGMDVNLFEVAR